MNAVGYSIRRVGEKKWKLFQAKAELGEFTSYEDAFSAMHLVITPVVHYFDANGNQIIIEA